MMDISSMNKGYIKIIYSAVLLFVCIGILEAQNPAAHTPHDRYAIANTSSSFTWPIQATAKDTCGKVIITNGCMTIFHWIADTAGTDSPSVKLHFDMYGANGWEEIATKTLSGAAVDSANGSWILTDSSIPNGEIARVWAEGLAGNKKDSSTLLKLTYDGYK